MAFVHFAFLIFAILCIVSCKRNAKLVMEQFCALYLVKGNAKLVMEQFCALYLVKGNAKLVMEGAFNATLEWRFLSFFFYRALECNTPY